MLKQIEITNLYVGIPFPESIALNKSSINLTTVGQTEQLTATIEPTVSDHSITWTTSDSTVATVSTSWLVTCVTPWSCTITATTVNGLTASCSVVDALTYQYIKWAITADRWADPRATQASEFEICDSNWLKMQRPAWTTISANHSWAVSSESIDKLIDGSVYTKYCTPYNPDIIITISLWSTVDFSVYNTYKWYTANDAPERDPVSRTIELSNDQSNWVTVDTVSDANITTSRYALAFTWTIIL